MMADGPLPMNEERYRRCREAMAKLSNEERQAIVDFFIDWLLVAQEWDPLPKKGAPPR